MRKRRGTKRPKNKTNFRKLKSPTEKCKACKQALPASIAETVVEATKDEEAPTRFEGVASAGGERDLDEFDVVIVRALRHTRDSLRPIYKALQKRYPKWKGLIWHLKPGEKLEHLPISVVQQIYESLMVRFDPDLWKIREERKAKAIKEAAAEDEKTEHQVAEEYADHLERIVADRDTAKLNNVAEATRRLEAAKASPNPQEHVPGGEGVSGEEGTAPGNTGVS